MIARQPSNLTPVPRQLVGHEIGRFGLPTVRVLMHLTHQANEDPVGWREWREWPFAPKADAARPLKRSRLVQSRDNMWRWHPGLVDRRGWVRVPMVDWQAWDEGWRGPKVKPELAWRVLTGVAWLHARDRRPGVSLFDLEEVAWTTRRDPVVSVLRRAEAVGVAEVEFQGSDSVSVRWCYEYRGFGLSWKPVGMAKQRRRRPTVGSRLAEAIA